MSLWLAGETGPVETFSMGYMKARNGGLYGGYRFQEDGGLHLLVCDPQTFPAGELLDHLNQNVPGTHIAGGLASVGGAGRGAHPFLTARRSIAVPWRRLTGVAADVVVSQGCRPIGSPYTVTRAEGNVMHELGGRPPFERLKAIVATLSEPDRELLANGGLQLGRVIDEYRPEQRRGDFLVRRVVGADPDTGAIVVGDELEVGQTVQFHVRDPESADQDLREALGARGDHFGWAGRRRRGAAVHVQRPRFRAFFPPDHDAGLVAKLLGEVPAGGFSCAGELGPVGGKNLLHGFTASVAIFR